MFLHAHMTCGLTDHDLACLVWWPGQRERLAVFHASHTPCLKSYYIGADWADPQPALMSVLSGNSTLLLHVVEC